MTNNNFIAVSNICQPITLMNDWKGTCVHFFIPSLDVYAIEKGKQKIPGRAESRRRSQPPTPRGREKVTQINVCIANKQMHDK